MNILLTNSSLRISGGSQTYLLTFLKELAKRGHTLTVFATRFGTFCREIERYACVVEEPPAQTFDLCFLMHRSTRFAVPEGVPIVQICHGIAAEEEHPISDADAYVAVSERVKSFVESFGFACSVVWNGIDTQEFFPSRSLPNRPKRVLYAGFHDEVTGVIEQACAEVGLRLSLAQGNIKAKHMARLYARNHIVIGLGRCVYEAMACGRFVIVFDHFGADGVMLPTTYQDFMWGNCTGLTHAMDWNVQDLVEAFSLYDPAVGFQNRGLIEQYQSAESMTEQLLAVATSLPAVKNV